MASGQYPHTYGWEAPCIARKALPKYNRAKLTFAESRFCCAERGHVPSTSFLHRLDPKLREDKTSWLSHQTPEARITPWVLPNIFCKYSGCHSVTPGLSRAKVSSFCHPSRRNQPASLVMRSARDGGSNTDFPVDYTEKALSWLQALLEG